MRDLFATLPDDPAPPMPADYLDRVLTRGRRSTRRHRIGAAAAWVVVGLALAVLVVPTWPVAVRPTAPSDRPGLPDQFAGYSILTSTVTKAPPGRAIALYGYGNGELFNMFQSLVVGADRDTYRQVDAMDERNRPSALLAPDGTRVLLGDDRGATTDLLLVDLATGGRRSIPIGLPVGVRLLAWSPDGRYVAYSAAPLSATDDSINLIDYTVSRTGTLRLLDIATGRSTDVPALTPAWTAAFAPDSLRLAVQVGQVAHLIDLDGHESGRVDIPAGRELAANVGWSADGAFLATVPWLTDGPASGGTDHGVFLYLAPGHDVAFVAITPTGVAAPAPLPDVVRLLGWRTPTSAVVATADAEGHLALAEVQHGDGGRPRLSQFDTGSTCELGTQTCQVFDLQLATGLLPDLTIRPAERPQRGPWPAVLTIAVAAVVLGAVLLLWRRLRRTAP